MVTGILQDGKFIDANDISDDEQDEFECSDGHVSMYDNDESGGLIMMARTSLFTI